MKEFVSIVKDNPPLKYSIAAVLLLEILAGMSFYFGYIDFERKTGIAVLGGIPLLTITLIQIYIGSLIQRASLIKDIALKLHTDKELSQAFHYLVYDYTDSRLSQFLNGEAQVRVEMNKDRPEGRRYYDPASVSGEEERLLDSLFGFLDMVAYHYHRRLIQMKDIAGVLGYQLSIILTRKAALDYLGSVPKFWAESQTGKRFGYNAVPLRYLDVMLKDFNVHCAKQPSPPL